MPSQGEPLCPAISLAYEGGLPEQVDAVLPILQSLDLRATFYLSPTDLLRDPRLWQTLQADGHEIGAHPFRGVIDEEGSLQNWTLTMVEEELDEGLRLWREVLPKQEASSVLLYGDAPTCRTSIEDPTQVSFLPAAQKRWELVASDKLGRNDALDQPLLSLPFENAERGILQCLLARTRKQWAILRVGNWPGMEAANEELCRWLVVEQPALKVAPVFNIGRMLLDRAQTTR